MISNGWKQVCKDEDILPPRKPPSHRTLVEMYVGRHRVKLTEYRNTMPPADYAKFEAWVEARVKGVP